MKKTMESKILADKAIKAEHVEVVILNLLATAKYRKEATSKLMTQAVRNYWGWSAGVDVHSPEGNKLVIRENGSEKRLSLASNYICKELKKFGYKTKFLT